MNEESAIRRLVGRLDDVAQAAYGAGLDRIGTVAAVGTGTIDIRVGQVGDEGAIVIPGVRTGFGETYAVGNEVYFRQFGNSRYTPGMGDCVVIKRLS